MGDTEQYVNSQFNENLSTFTNEGSLKSKLANMQRMILEEDEEEEAKSSQHKVSYCNFQIPVMLTPS